MRVNEDVTIYNRKYDPKARGDVWRRTAIKGVHFYLEHKVQLLATGLVNADLYKIRIPQGATVDKKYAPREEYQAAADVSELWTIQKGDCIVRGVGPDVSSPAELQKEGFDVCTITAWSDNRRGGLPHWRVEGV